MVRQPPVAPAKRDRDGGRSPPAAPPTRAQAQRLLARRSTWTRRPHLLADTGDTPPHDGGRRTLSYTPRPYEGWRLHPAVCNSTRRSGAHGGASPGSAQPSLLSVPHMARGHTNCHRHSTSQGHKERPATPLSYRPGACGRACRHPKAARGAQGEGLAHRRRHPTAAYGQRAGP